MLSSKKKIVEYTRRGWWGSSTLYELFHRNARSTPDRIAVVDPPNKREIMDAAPVSVTYSDFDRLIAQFSLALASMGIKRRDVLVVQLPNTLELVATLLAGARIGAVLSPLPMPYGAHELAHVVSMIKPKAIITVGRYKKRAFAGAALDLARHSDFVDHVLCPSSGDLTDLLDGSQWTFASAKSADPDQRATFARASANDVFSICWTSGTEATPKAVPRTHNHWIALGKCLVENVGIGQAETLLNPFPMVNAAGIGSLLVPWLLTGGKLVQHHPFDQSTFIEQVQRERVNYTVAAPAVLNSLLKDSGPEAKAHLATLRRIGCGAAPLSPWMVTEFERTFAIPVINILGSNEGILLVSNAKEVPDPAVRARVFPRFGVKEIEWESRTSRWMETKLVDPSSGKEITSVGVPGEIVIKGPMVFDGYFGNAELSNKVFDDAGFFHTGDLLEITNIDGRPTGYKFVGRLKEIIIRGGVNISPEEIEELIIGHPKVKEVAVIGYPDEVLGERSCAVVVPVPDQDIDLDEINAFLSARQIARYKLPERLHLVDRLPRNALGKVVRRRISLPEEVS